MAVPAGEVLAWLASGALEQVGTLPPDDEHGEPVFTVSTPELQRDLTARLGGIGKAAVVLTPLHVRSFLIRTMLRAQPAAPTNADDGIADGSELQRVLLDAANEVLADIEVMQHLAAEEAQLEAAELARQQQEAAPEHEADAEAAEPVDEEDGMDGEVFDFDDLAQALDHLDGSSSPPSGPVDSTAVDGGAGAAPAAEPTPLADATAAGQAAAVDDDTAHEFAPAAAMAPSPATNATERAEVTTRDEQPEAVDDGDAMNDTEHAAENAPAATSADAAADSIVVTAEEALAIAGEEPPESGAAAGTVEQPPALPSAAAAAEPAESVAEDADTGPSAGEPAPAPTAGTAISPDPELLQAAVQAAAHEATEQSMQRVESFLGQLKDALVQMANRPAAPGAELSSLVTTVQSALERTQQQAESQQVALQTLGDKLSDLGQRVENGVTHGVAAVLERALPAAAQPAVATPRYVVHRGDRSAAALIGVMVLVLCWSLVFWFKTESLRLAVSTLVGANVIGCCLLVARRHGTDG